MLFYVNNKNLSFKKYDVLSFILFVYTNTLGYYLYISISIYLSIYLSTYLSIYLYIYIYIYIYMVFTTDGFLEVGLSGI